MKKLPRSFYLRPTLVVAKELLGKYFVRKFGKQLFVGKIVEVEAYLGKKDPASHTFRGKTKRNEVMFRKGGHLYVYFTYGMHFCANVVTEEAGIGHAVLLRAVEPLEGIEKMKHNRGFNRQQDGGQATDDTDYRMLTNGPAKLCEAFGIKRNQNGTDLTECEIFITKGVNIPKSSIQRSTRIGIRHGTEKQWRFFIRGNTFVSRRS